MSFAVRFTSSATKDPRAINTYIATNDTLENADYVAREIVKAALTLRDLPIVAPGHLNYSNMACAPIAKSSSNFIEFSIAFAEAPCSLPRLPMVGVTWLPCFRGDFQRHEPRAMP